MFILSHELVDLLGCGQLKAIWRLQFGQLAPRVKLYHSARPLEILVRTVVLQFRTFEDEPSPVVALLVLRPHLVQVSRLFISLLQSTCDMHVTCDTHVSCDMHVAYNRHVT